MSTLSAVLAQWQFVGADLGHSTVLPDGRRDLNLNQAAEGRARWIISGLASSACHVPVRPGEHLMGWRLQPAARLDEARVLAARPCNKATPTRRT